MTHDFQRRVTHTQFRASPDGVEGRIVAKVLTYNVVDDYMTAFAPGLFNDEMDKRMPRIVWSHDWAEPLGRWERYVDSQTSLELAGQLDDFNAVPRARQAWAQLQSGTIDQFSVGFMPLDAQPAVIDGQDVLMFTRGRMDEASLVLVGAVPDTELVALRSPRQPTSRIVVVRTPTPTIEVDVDSLAELLTQVETGDTSAPAALAMLTDADDADDADDAESDTNDAASDQGEADEGTDGDAQDEDNPVEDDGDELGELVLEGDLDDLGALLADADSVLANL